MSDITKLLDHLKELEIWGETFKKIESNIFFQPIREGKWSIAQIIAHIAFWDEYITEEILPAMLTGRKDIVSINIETLNQKAAVFALSGVTAEDLANRMVESRRELLFCLSKAEKQHFECTFSLNGETIDPYTGQPHSMYGYFDSFVWHDRHHMKQIEDYLREQKSVK